MLSSLTRVSRTRQPILRLLSRNLTIPVGIMKRAREEPSSSAPSKAPKLASIFTRPAPAADAPFKWHSSTKESATLLHGTHGAPVASARVALFDLDGTVIESSFGRGAPKGKGRADPLAWKWWRPVVPRKLKTLVDEGYAVVFISNQGIKPDKLVDWKRKIPLIAAAIPDVPFHIYAATARDGFRKPMPCTFYALERLFAASGVTIDKAQSFFIGDAAGRAGDFAATDRKWALNVGVPFFTPEEYFLGLKPVPYTVSGFHVSSLPAPPVPTPTAELVKLSLLPPEPTKPAEPTRTPSIEEVVLPDAAASATIAPSTTNSPSSELVLFVGPPAIGKTTHYTRHFAPRGYVHINQDTLGTRAKCIAAARAALAAGSSAVIDNTNRDAGTRAEYTKLAREAGAGVRCVLFEGGVELARHNNLYRAYIAPALGGEKRRAALPEMALAAFRTAYVEPRIEEGFVSVERVPFVFEGGEEERARWGMWLSVDK